MKSVLIPTNDRLTFSYFILSMGFLFQTNMFKWRWAADDQSRARYINQRPHGRSMTPGCNPCITQKITQPMNMKLILELTLPIVDPTFHGSWTSIISDWTTPITSRESAFLERTCFVCVSIWCLCGDTMKVDYLTQSTVFFMVIKPFRMVYHAVATLTNENQRNLHFMA